MEFEALITRYEAEPNVDAPSDAIKKAVLVLGCPEQLKTHLQMNLQTYASYGSIRNAVQSYIEVKRTWRSEAAQASSSTDMEVDAVCKDGYKGKSKHLRQARTRSERLLVQRNKRRKRKRQGQRKGKQKGKGKDKDKSVTQVSQEDSQSSNNSQIVANVTSGWIFAVTWTASLGEIYESEGEIFLDRGAYDQWSSSSKVRHWNGAQHRWQRDTDSRTKKSSSSTGGRTDSFGRVPSHERETVHFQHRASH